MERFFQVAAVVLAGIAAYFLWAGNSDGAFVTAVLGAVAFFLSVRFQVKERNKIREAEFEEQLRTGEIGELEPGEDTQAETREARQSIERER